MKTEDDKKIKSEESLVKGKWLFKEGNIVEDESCVRIKWLINNSLKKIRSDNSGWDILYEDPNDNRLWELLYLDSEFQGGGPPTLSCISQENARKKYRI